ncbi:MAG: PQQ-dependent sugar dehydrogenase [Vicinamibacteria bacterium]
MPSPRRTFALRVGALSLLAAALVACGGGGGSGAPDPVPSPTAATCATGTPVSGTPSIVARLVVSGLRSPLDLQSVREDRERLYVVEQGGRIRVVRNGQLEPTAFLDVSDRISTGGERGLLGLAFHPRFAQNRRFFVNYTDPSGDTRLAEFTASSPDSASASTERLLLRVSQPFSNHNGGGLAFGSDGYLYAGLGDGGSGGDPLGNGQRLDTHLGKMLRIDVDAGSPYAVPADNPFRARAGALPEIWAYGLRNPFRFSFDRVTGELYVGDVGQGSLEEIDVAAARAGGQNYGWNVTEGSSCYSPRTGCDKTGITGPVFEYDHSQGCSVTGGVVYRGCRMPGLAGTYFFGDFCRGSIRSFRFSAGQATDVRSWSLSGPGAVSSFGVDADGEVYVVDYAGAVYRLEPAS